MTIKDVKNLFTEDAKQKYVQHAKKNNGLSFHEFCKKIKKECDDKNEYLLYATDIVDNLPYLSSDEF